MADNTQPRWYFSLRSPYSWLAYHDLSQRFPDVLDALEWIPCWEPDQPMTEQLAHADVLALYTPMSRAKHFYILRDVKRLTEARGLTVTWPVDRDPTWDVTNLAYLLAEREGRGREFVAAAYRDRWTRAKVIWRRDAVAEIARELGLDPVATANAADDPDLRRIGVACLARAERDGAFGVPYFVHGRNTFWGLDRVPELVASVRGVSVDDLPDYEWRAGVPASAMWVAAGGDAGHPGGCG
jgi:2-hydroxychromene-2-carboxylate isomerase